MRELTIGLAIRGRMLSQGREPCYECNLSACIIHPRECPNIKKSAKLGEETPSHEQQKKSIQTIIHINIHICILYHNQSGECISISRISSMYQSIHVMSSININNHDLTRTITLRWYLVVNSIVQLQYYVFSALIHAILFHCFKSLRRANMAGVYIRRNVTTIEPDVNKYAATADRLSFCSTVSQTQEHFTNFVEKQETSQKWVGAIASSVG